MSKKINYDNLYVAFSIFDHEVETEKYEQYETFGTIEHRIVINPKRKLIYSKFDEEGKEHFYDYKSNEEVYEESYESSFKTESSPYQSLYCGYINGHIIMPIRELRKDIIERYKKKQHVVGYLVPLDKYIEEKLGINITSWPLTIVDKLLSVMNIGAGKSFILSMDPEEAKVQLEKIGYRKQTIKKQK